MLSAGVDACANKNRLTRQREARAFKHYDGEDGRVAVVLDQGLNQGGIEKCHGAHHCLTFKNAIGGPRRPRQIMGLPIPQGRPRLRHDPELRECRPQRTGI